MAVAAFKNGKLAQAYHLSTKAVDTYRHRLLKKLSLRNNAELTRFLFRTGWWSSDFITPVVRKLLTRKWGKFYEREVSGSV